MIQKVVYNTFLSSIHCFNNDYNISVIFSTPISHFSQIFQAFISTDLLTLHCLFQQNSKWNNQKIDKSHVIIVIPHDGITKVIVCKFTELVGAT